MVLAELNGHKISQMNEWLFYTVLHKYAWEHWFGVSIGFYCYRGLMDQRWLTVDRLFPGLHLNDNHTH